MNLKELEAFRAVMMTGTTTGASKSLHLSQPAVSRHIANLEAYCGVKLFIRKSGRLQPTAEAEALLGEIENFQDGFQKFDNFLKGMKSFRSEHLRIVATSPMAHGLLPHVLSLFHNDYPDTTTALRIVPRRQLREGLEARPFDIGLVTLPIDVPTGECKPFTKVEGVCILPPGHHLTEKPIVDVSDLEGERFVCAAPDSPSRQMIDQVLARAHVHCKQIAETHSALSVCSLVAAGTGVSLVDPFTASTVRDWGIVMRPFEPAFTYEFGIIFPVQRAQSRLAELFANYVDCAAAQLVDNANRWKG